MNNFIEELKQIKSEKLQIFENEKLDKYSTMRIGGCAEVVVLPKNLNGFLLAYDIIKKNKIPFYVIGNGSNTLCSSNGFKGAVFCTKHMNKLTLNIRRYNRVYFSKNNLKIKKMKLLNSVLRTNKVDTNIITKNKQTNKNRCGAIDELRINSLSEKTIKNGVIKGGELCIFAECGVLLPKISQIVCGKGFTGIEFACGIPASVGGAVKMNAGAFGGQMSDCITNVLIYNLKTHAIYYRKNKTNCKDFSYVASYRKTNISEDEFIVGVEMVFKKGNKATIEKIKREMTQKRVATQSVGYPSLGSVFKRSENFIPSEFIDKCGLKGLTVGGAQISKVHAGYIVNYNNATSEDVLKLLKLVRKLTCEISHIVLQYEVKLLGDKDEEEQG